MTRACKISILALGLVCWPISAFGQAELLGPESLEVHVDLRASTTMRPSARASRDFCARSRPWTAPPHDRRSPACSRAFDSSPPARATAKRWSASSKACPPASPSIAIGSAIGGGLGGAWLLLWPADGPSLAAFAFVGAAAFLATTMRAPFTALVLVVEFTQQGTDILVPSLLAVSGAVAVGYVLARRRSAQMV